MTQWPSTSSKKVYRALLRIGWQEKPRIGKSGSHKQLKILTIHTNSLGHFMTATK